jgi:hypothetical protein
LIFKKYETLLKEEIKGIKFYWEKENNNHKYSYKACVKWDKVDIEQIKESNYKELDQLFYDILKRNLYDIFNSQIDLSLQSFNIDDKRRYFDQWLSNAQNKDIIISTYVTVYSSLHKKKSYPSPETLAQSFINRIIKFRGNDMHLIFNNVV